MGQNTVCRECGGGLAEIRDKVLLVVQKGLPPARVLNVPVLQCRQCGGYAVDDFTLGRIEAAASLLPHPVSRPTSLWRYPNEASLARSEIRTPCIREVRRACGRTASYVGPALRLARQRCLALESQTAGCEDASVKAVIRGAALLGVPVPMLLQVAPVLERVRDFTQS